MTGRGRYANLEFWKITEQAIGKDSATLRITYR